jgi:hypothetical protein
MKNVEVNMKKNSKIVLIAVTVVIVLVLAVVFVMNGKNMSEKFLGDKVEQTKDSQNENTNIKTNPDATTSELPTPTPEPTPIPTPAVPKHIQPVKVKAVYYSGSFAGSDSRLDHIIEVINKTELNALVVDIKEGGFMKFKSELPEVIDNKLYEKFYDVDKVIKKLHENNIYVIGRIVCFRDDGLAAKRPDLAIKKPDGSFWLENYKDPKTKWTNPYNQDVWRYNVDIAKEAVDKGFDEIQFDYVRFPAASSKEVDYGVNPGPKSDAINGFLDLAQKEIKEGMGIQVSADIFGIVSISPPDGNSIGQVIETIGMKIDYLCPMVYPSHFANAGHGLFGNGTGQDINGIKFTAPDLQPYEIVYNSLLTTKRKIATVPGYKAKIRPYLQDFSFAKSTNKAYFQDYGVEQLRQQIKAVYDAGYEEWIFWDGKNTYTEDAFLKD